MRTILGLVLAAVVGFACLGDAEEAVFEGGWLRCQWSADLQFLIIEAAVETLPDAGHTWVLTSYSHRFEDGVFAWQIHFSETVDSALILPNDFLTARNFTTAQLGIEARLTFSDQGPGILVRIPVAGVIPHLAAAGDWIEVHALWMQQAPLASMVVPPSEPLALQQAGGGGEATAPDSAVPTYPLPELDQYVQGQSIAHRFVTQEQPPVDGVARVVFSYTLMLLHEAQPAEFVRFAHIAYDFETGTYSYSIDTSNLVPGLYRLLIGSPNSSLSYHMELTIAAAGN